MRPSIRILATVTRILYAESDDSSLGFKNAPNAIDRVIFIRTGLSHVEKRPIDTSAGREKYKMISVVYATSQFTFYSPGRYTSSTARFLDVD